MNCVSNLYRIDLSAVVSKYIGETEKNLRRALRRRRGRRRDPVLRRGRRAVRQTQRGQGQPRPLRQHRDQLPAPADGSVSRPGDPRHQHERARWTRRSCGGLRFIVNFPFPGADGAHGRSGGRCFLRKTPVRGTWTIERLAPLQPGRRQHPQHRPQCGVPGGAGGAPVTMPLILEAARSEFRKLERPINEADFRLMKPAGGKA